MASTASSTQIVLGCLALLAVCVTVIYALTSEPFYLVRTHHILYLFSASDACYLAAMLLMSLQLLRDANGAAGISLHAQRFGMAAGVMRAYFQWEYADTTVMLVLLASMATNVALLALLEPSIARLVPHPNGGTFMGAVPEKFESAKLLGGIGAIGVIAWLCSGIEAVSGIEAEANHHHRWVSLVVGISLQGGSLVPQRARLLRTRSLPALTSHAYLMVGLSVALRLLMWMLLCLEREFHPWLMLGDFIHTGLVADYAAIYMAALRDHGIGSLLPFTSSLSMGRADAV